MLRIIILLTIGFQTTFGQSLTGQVFHLAETYLEDKCIAIGQGDCDTSDLFFLTDKQFCLITRCIDNDSYFSGTYLVRNKKLILTFKQAEVNVITNDQSKTETKRNNAKIETRECIINSCGQKVKLVYSDIESGSRVTQIEEKEMTEELKRTTAWKLLQD
jgi:hypothetical protein